jgi:hypothetical protein
MGKSKKRRAKARIQGLDVDSSRHTAIQVDHIDLADRFEEDCAKAISIASLMMEADADVAVQNAAWVVRDLVEKIRNIGRIVFKTVTDASDVRIE